MIWVSTDTPMWIEDPHDGQRYRFGGYPSREKLPPDVYRRLAKLGEFRRHLRLVEGYGRTYWIDMLWEREQRRPVRRPTIQSGVRKSGCGCGRKRDRKLLPT